MRYPIFKAIEEASRVADKVTGYGLSMDKDSLQKIKKQFGELKDYGITP